MPTWRRFNRGAYQCGLYEAQDVIAASDGVDLIHVEALPSLRRREHWHRNLVYHDPSGLLVSTNPGLRPVYLTREYDLFVVVCQRIQELLYVNAIKGWKRQCHTTVCWIDELWAPDVPKYGPWLQLLEQFDLVCVSYRGTVAPLSKALGRECHWIPGGVDVLRFCPFPGFPKRVIDVYSIGRRREGIHRALLEFSRSRHGFYIHDTFRLLSSADPIDDQQHREMYANMAKRSRFFLVAPGKVVPDESGSKGGQSELGFRYYEGAAAGAILVGEAPDDESFRMLFGWPESVVSVAPDGSDVVETLETLMSQPERLAAASITNAVQSLRQHDWVYRWKSLIERAGLQPTAGMQERILRLHEIADLMTASSG